MVNLKIFKIFILVQKFIFFLFSIPEGCVVGVNNYLLSGIAIIWAFFLVIIITI